MDWGWWGRVQGVARSPWVIQVREDGGFVSSGDSRDDEMDCKILRRTESI